MRCTLLIVLLSCALAVWHERFGTTSRKVTIGARQSQTAHFTLAAAK